MNDDELIDRHLGEDATVTLPLRLGLDLWMAADGWDYSSADGTRGQRVRT